MKPKTLAEFARMGGKASWKNVSKKERSERMRKLALKRWGVRKSKKVPK